MKDRKCLPAVIFLAALLLGPGCLAGGGLEPAAAPQANSTSEESKPSAKNSHWTFLWVKTKRASLHEGPGTQYYVITPIVKGARLIMMAKQGEWYQVNLRSASINGWIHESVVSEEEVAREK
jgi:uncharacterized protein YgiM (DUF1202 family)